MAFSIYSFPKIFRVRDRKSFLILAKSSLQFKGQLFFIQWIPNKYGYARLGITLTKKFGSSCQRNYFKRVIREAFRKECTFRHCLGIDFNIRPRKKGEVPVLQEIEQEIKIFFKSVEVSLLESKDTSKGN